MRLTLLLCFPIVVAAQNAPPLPPPSGFRVMIVPDMEGMGSAVDIHEVIAGNEGEQYRTLGVRRLFEHLRRLQTGRRIRARQITRSLLERHLGGRNNRHRCERDERERERRVPCPHHPTRHLIKRTVYLPDA